MSNAVMKATMWLWNYPNTFRNPLSSNGNWGWHPIHPKRNHWSQASSKAEQLDKRVPGVMRLLMGPHLPLICVTSPSITGPECFALWDYWLQYSSTLNGLSFPILIFCGVLRSLWHTPWGILISITICSPWISYLILEGSSRISSTDVGFAAAAILCSNGRVNMAPKKKIKVEKMLVIFCRFAFGFCFCWLLQNPCDMISWTVPSHSGLRKNCISTVGPTKQDAQTQLMGLLSLLVLTSVLGWSTFNRRYKIKTDTSNGEAFWQLGSRMFTNVDMYVVHGEDPPANLPPLSMPVSNGGTFREIATRAWADDWSGNLLSDTWNSYEDPCCRI